MTGRRVGLMATALVGLVAVAGLAAMLGDDTAPLRGGSAAADTVSDRRTITVTGEGEATVIPDTAQVSLGVEIRNPDLGAAQAEATQKMTAVIDSLKRNGVDERQIRTVNYSIHVERNYERQDQPITGYIVTNIVRAKIKPMDRVGQLIDEAVQAGANAVYEVSFAAEDVDAAVRQARELAMQAARDKAEQLARLGGVTLGQPVSITENSSTPPMPYPAAAEGRTVAADAAVPIQPGETTIVVSVTVSYGI